ncbi:MAG: sel1 repeat family protein [Clostridia bacterium]|nr:sel1 repeat family protein [Clostridia bacterium]
MKRIMAIILACVLAFGMSAASAEDVDLNALFQEARQASADGDAAKANALFEQLYALGDYRGAEMLASAYQNGDGVEQSYTKAMEWNFKAVNMGSGRGWANVGQMYEKGQGVPQSSEKAVMFYTLSMDSALSNPDFKGPRYAGVLYENGFVNDAGETVQDMEKAAECYLIAADHGDVTGCAYIGRLYQEGTGVEQNYELAAKYYLSALGGDHIVPGMAEASFGMGYLYENGLGVEKNLEEALACYQLAADNGVEAAQEAVTRLSNQ